MLDKFGVELALIKSIRIQLYRHKNLVVRKRGLLQGLGQVRVRLLKSQEHGDPGSSITDALRNAPGDAAQGAGCTR